MMHWPAPPDLCGVEPCDMFLRQDMFPDVTFAHLPVRHTCARTPEVDPMSRVIGAPGVGVVDAQEFRTRGETGGIETPLVKYECLL